MECFSYVTFFLVAIQFGHIMADSPISDFPIERTWIEGSEGKINLPDEKGNADYCQLQKPNGEKIMLKTPECTFTINAVSKSNAGIWTIHYSLKVLTQDKIQYNISVQDSLRTGAQSISNESSKVSPEIPDLSISNFPIERTWIEGSEGKIDLRLVKGDVNYCKLQKPNGEKIMLKTPECTFTIETVSKTNAGIWTIHYSLKALTEDKIQYNISVQGSLKTGAQSISNESSTVLSIFTDSPIIDIPIERTWIKGSKGKIDLPLVKGNVNYCQLQRANGEKIMLKTPACIHTINEVSKSDAGIWTIRYSLKVLTEDKIQYNITVQDY